MPKKTGALCENEKNLHRKKLKKISLVTAAVTTGLIILLVLTLFILATANNNSYGDYLRSRTAAVVGDIELNGAVMSIIFYDDYHTYAPYITADASLSLKEQYAASGDTLFELFLQIAKVDAKRLLTECKAASDMGITLSDAEKSALRRRADNTQLSFYPEGISADDVYHSLILRAMAAKYQHMAQAELEPSEKDAEEYVSKSDYEYKYVDMMAFSIYYSDADDGEVGSVFDMAEAQAHADKLANSSDPEAFKQAVRAIITGGTPDMSESVLEEYLSSLALSRMPYKNNDAVMEWAFSAKVGDTFMPTDEKGSTCTVYMLTRGPYVDENPSKSCDIILLSDTDYVSHEELLLKADEIMTEFNASGNSSENFALSAMEFSSDSMSFLNGGTYMRVLPGDMLSEIDAWLFSEQREKGDTTVVEITGGCAVLHFRADGIPAWHAAVADDIVSDGYNALCRTLEEGAPVLFDETVLDSIPA